MSQKKVDKYKQDKANRQKIMKREKVLRRVEITVAAVVLAALLVWFCIAVYRNSQEKALENADTVTTSLDLTEVDSYINGLTTEASSSEAAE